MLGRIKQEKIVGVIRVSDAETAILAALAVSKGGVKVLEIPATVPGFPEAIGELAKRSELAVGAASVLTSDQARDSVEAGAAFLVSPCFSLEVEEVASSAGLLYLPGAATPTEIHDLVKRGYELIKVFPASHLGGPKFIRAILSTMPSAQLLPTGGVSVQNVREYFESGAVAVGVGGELLPRASVRNGDWESIARLASQFASCREPV